MNKNDAGKLVRRFLILFSMIACLILVGGKQPAEAVHNCNLDDAYACLDGGGQWTFVCCKCVPFYVVENCENSGGQYNICTGVCEPIQ
jgi:hypothetical protein